MNNHAPAVPVPQLFYLQLPQLPSRATFPPRTTELSAAPVLSCAQYRPAAAFPTSGPVYLRCVTSSRSHSIPTPGQQHTYYIAAPGLPPGLACTWTSPRSHRHSLRLWPSLISSLQLPAGVSVLELVSALHSLTVCAMSIL